MHEMKCRAWDRIQQKMIPWEKLCCQAYNLLNRINGGSNWEYEWSTGLHDRNGKEIYEGDILVSYPKKNSCGIVCAVDGVSTFTRIVVWLDADAKFGWMLLDGTINQSGFCLCDENAKTIFEVIGNIHENPELLKESE